MAKYSTEIQNVMMDAESDEMPQRRINGNVEMRSSFIPFISDASDAMVTAGRDDELNAFSGRGGYLSLLQGKRERRSNGNNFYLFPDSSQKDFLNWLRQRAKQPRLCCTQRGQFCFFLPVCVPKCDLCTWTHIVAQGNGHRLKCYTRLMKYTEGACRREMQLGERQHSAAR